MVVVAEASELQVFVGVIDSVALATLVDVTAAVVYAARASIIAPWELCAYSRAVGVATRRSGHLCSSISY
jgi:hypothetical protein